MPPTISIWDGLRRNNDRSGKMRSRTTMELFQYWNEVRGDRDLPRRDEIQPADIRSLLPNVFILQAQADGGIHFRLAGTHICGLFGDELRHRQFSALWLGGQQEEAARIAGQVMKRCTPMLLAASGATATGDRLDVEILLTPSPLPMERATAYSALCRRCPVRYGCT